MNNPIHLDNVTMDLTDLEPFGFEIYHFTFPPSRQGRGNEQAHTCQNLNLKTKKKKKKVWLCGMQTKIRIRAFPIRVLHF